LRLWLAAVGGAVRWRVDQRTVMGLLGRHVGGWTRKPSWNFFSAVEPTVVADALGASSSTDGSGGERIDRMLRAL